MAVDELANHRIVLGPVGHHVNHAPVRKGGAHFLGEQYGLLVGEAGDTPVRRDIDKHRHALAAQAREGFRRPGYRALTTGDLGCASGSAQGSQQDGDTEAENGHRTTERAAPV